MAVLQMLKGELPGQQFHIDSERAILGRHPDCDVVLDAAAVSRQHAQLLFDGNDYYVEDLHSRNGTFVNGNQIQGRQMLHEGDRIKICDLSFNFFRHEPSDKLPNLNFLTATASSMALFEDDGENGNSTVMSKLEVSSSRSGVRLIVNPEVKLRAFIEISQNLARAVSLDDVLPKILDSLFKIFVQADRGFVMLRSGTTGPLLPKAIKHRRTDQEDRIRVSRTILNQVMSSKEAILSADAATDQRFDQSESIADLRIRSVMCAPLVDGEGNALGVIQIDTADQRHRFSREDLDVLASVASQAAVAIDNAQLHEQAMRQQATERDLLLAHKVQRGLLPSHPPQIPGYHFFDFYEPAYQVGGDYYDYIDLPSGRLAVVLGDVSGKGVSAALLMAKLSGEVRYCLASERTAAGAMNRINTSFSRSGWEDRFVTFVLAVLDTKKHEVTVVNAGHMPPLLRHDGEVIAIGADETGLPLGVDATHTYSQCSRKIEPGDFMTIFTDGISEAMNSASDLYGLDRLRAQVGANAANVDILGRHILDDVKRFVGGRQQSDDMCLTCFGRSRE